MHTPAPARPFAALAAGALLLLLLPPLGSRGEAGETVRMARKLWNGQRLAAEESSHTEVETKARGWDTARTGDQVGSEFRSYTQEMTVDADGRPEIRRTYTKAIQSGDQLHSSKVEERPTSLAGKVVYLSMKQGRPEVRAAEGRIAFEDQDGALWPEQLYALRPAAAVESGKPWAADATALGKVFFGGAAATLLGRGAGGARGVLRGYVQVDGRRCAEIQYQLDVGAGATATGTLHFSLEDGTILGFEMSGPIAARVGLGGASAQATGTRSVKYRAHIAEHGVLVGEAQADRAGRGQRGRARDE
ncbi:MAG: hypothetical protein HZA54_20705 [Planctomycetes bacterium]|nr:hypothetical protein [Planctomycetota bacterium]